MTTDHQKPRPAVLLFCGLVLLGLFATIWLGPKLLSSSPVQEIESPATIAQSPQPQATLPPKPLLPPPRGKPPHEWGIEVVGLFPAVGGRALDLRYKILDPVKASLLPNQPGGIYITDEATGITTKSPNSTKTGSIPQNPQKLRVGRNYSLGLPNPEGRFKSGSQVTVVIGGLCAEHLTVQ